MKKIAASFFLLTFVACSNLSKPIEIPTFTAVPARMATDTPMPRMTSLPPSETQNVFSEWNGIPIMPGAIAGEGDEEGYVFTISATPQSVQEYYQLELGKLGWQPFTQSVDDSSITLIYMNKEGETLTISLLVKEEEVLVLLAK